MKRTIFALVLLAVFFQSAFGREEEEKAESAVESVSPDGRFAFHTTTGPEPEHKTYDLIEAKPGKVLAHVAESDEDLGPSARFGMTVQWRPDSKAFALTATLIKLGSEVSVWWRDGDTFRKVELPELLAEIPDKEKRGKHYPHVSALSSHSVKQWRKDGSLVMEILSMQDGEAGTITATRTVVLSFTPSGKAKVLTSTIKFVREPQ